MEKKKKLKGFIGLILILFGIIITGCSTPIAWHKMELDVTKPPHSQIHNVINQTVELDMELKRQVEDIMRNYVDYRGEEFGYYTVVFDYGVDTTNFGWFWFFLSGITLCIPNLVGMPWSIDDYGLRAYLHFFDSQGNLVQTFKNSNHFTLVQGFYYGDPTRKAGKIYSELLEDLLRQADRDTRLINAMLEEVGPVTIENTAAARSKIRSFEKEN